MQILYLGKFSCKNEAFTKAYFLQVGLNICLVHQRGSRGYLDMSRAGRAALGVGD
jgi:hypothetical protein